MEIPDLRFTDESRQHITVTGKRVTVFIFVNSMIISVVAIIALVVIAYYQPQPGYHREIPADRSATPVEDPATADLIEATGSGNSENAAFLDAQRQAIIKKLGVFIAAETIVENFRVIRDRIRQQPIAGYVSHIKRLTPAKEVRPGKWQVTILCRVSTDKLWHTIKNNLESARSLFGYRRVVVVTPQSTGTNRQAGLKELVIAVEDRLLQEGFRVFKKEFAQASFAEIIAALRDYLYHPLFEDIAKDSNSFVICVDLESRQENGRPLLKAQVGSRNLGRKFVSLPSRFQPVPSLDSQLDWEKGAQLCAGPLVETLLQRLVTQLSRYGTGREYFLLCREFAPATQQTIWESLEALHHQRRLLWLGDPDTKVGLTVDIAAATDPQVMLQQQLRQLGIQSYCYRQGNLVIIVPAPDHRWLIAVCSAALLVAIIVLLFCYRKLKCVSKRKP